ncbi:MAG TPA: arginine--tRNA ligase [Puia sp.]|jgi:arginyl-tRNA synthetase|nr:arginine--tRNA ligase [Puia sp.]
MELVPGIKLAVQAVLAEKYNYRIDSQDVLVNETKPEFRGDYTVVLFSYSKILKTSPDALGQGIGEALLNSNPGWFSEFNVIKGFLNLVMADNILIDFLHTQYNNASYGSQSVNGKRVMVEYSSPNTNKPLHLGHLRNNFLGWSVAAIYKILGYGIIKTCIANDRGIHICKSMVAWKLFANGATPESTGLKGDHFVGDYYVLFGVELKKQVETLLTSGLTKEKAEKEAPLMKAAQKMLVDWEAGVPEVIELWKKMNAWVYAGFDITYKRIGSDFDKIYYESQTYLLGKDLVEMGLDKKVFFKKEDGSVWIDLKPDGLDEKIVQRSDGTAVYMTQDIGLADRKYEEYHTDLSIYVVADEQNYHFKVLKLICQKLQLPSAAGLYHLSYGLVELPSGRMKTREGTVVDADDIIDEMTGIAAKHTEELGKVDDFTEKERKELYDTIGLGALKFFLLRVDPKKRMVFNPDESIDFHGFTGPFVQYAHARIKSILRKESIGEYSESEKTALLPLEKELLISLEKYSSLLQQACVEMNPSLVANYVFSIAKIFNSFYSEHSIGRAESEHKKQLRLRICVMTANIIQSAMSLLGIRVPERM